MQIVALDKTGTITSGEPKVTDMIPAEGISEEELLGFAYALERKSEHPLAHAILQEAEDRRINAEEVEELTDFRQFLQERRFMVEIRNLSRQRLLWMQER